METKSKSRKFDWQSPFRRCLTFGILPFLICLTQAAFAQQQIQDTLSLDKYSYLIYGETSSGSIVQATGFLVKTKKQLYLVTACHVVNGWYYESYEKDGSYPDTLYLRTYSTTSDSVVFVPINIKKIKNDKSDLGWVDVYCVPITMPPNVRIYSIESLILYAQSYNNDPDKLMSFGFHLQDDDVVTQIINARAEKAIAHPLKGTYGSDPLVYQMAFNGEVLGPGSSGSPVYFIYDRIDHGKQLITIRFGGLIFGGSSSLHQASAVRPEVIRKILRGLK